MHMEYFLLILIIYNENSRWKLYTVHNYIRFIGLKFHKENGHSSDEKKIYVISTSIYLSNLYSALPKIERRIKSAWQEYIEILNKCDFSSHKIS